MKKYTGADRKNRYALSLSALLISCMLWTGCGMEDSRNAGTGQSVEAVATERINTEGTSTEDANKEEPDKENSGEGSVKKPPLLEQLFSYEINKNYGNPYLIITGIAEEYQDAPNFGYNDWQAPGCSSWCGAYGFEQEVQASSELASADGRYAAGNMLRQDRQQAWVEGVEGTGIGESILYHQSCTYGTNNKWEAITYDNHEPVLDGFMRYSEICIVNGYAKTPKTWEENGRIKKLLLYVENRPYAYLELEDTIQPQYFKLPEDDIKVLSGGMLEARFEIVEVYPGSVYEDTCLTGLIMEFTGRYAH